MGLPADMFGSTWKFNISESKTNYVKAKRKRISGWQLTNRRERERVKKSQPSNATSRSSGFPLETSEEDEGLREEGRSTRQPGAVGWKHGGGDSSPSTSACPIDFSSTANWTIFHTVLQQPCYLFLHSAELLAPHVSGLSKQRNTLSGRHRWF